MIIAHRLPAFISSCQVELKDGEEDEDILFDVYVAQGRMPFTS